MEKLRNGKWKTDIATKEEFNNAVAEIRAIVAKYNWQDKIIHPYAFATKIGDFINGDGWTNFHQYTFSSKQILIDEVNGLIDILNHWVELEEEEKIAVRIIGGNKDGQIEKLPKSFVAQFLECGMMELV